jgi:2'-5' RNA ligase
MTTSPPDDTSPEQGDLYVSLSIAPTPTLSRARRELCERAGLVERTEFHVTLGFIGAMPDCGLDALREAFASRGPWEVAEQLKLTGLGGYVSTADETPIPFSLDALASAHTWRVAWWAVERSPELARLQARIGETILAAGAPRDTRPFWPHLTLGSNTPAGENGGKWDVHGVVKDAAITRAGEPDVVEVVRLHLTDSVLNPGSLFVLGTPPKAG